MARADEAWARKDTKATGSRKSKHDSRPSLQITLAVSLRFVFKSWLANIIIISTSLSYGPSGNFCF